VLRAGGEPELLALPLRILPAVVAVKALQRPRQRRPVGDDDDGVGV
jgi:hypothetical protein